ncbi:nucleoside:proton symporter [Phormidium tenue FACHB-886]|nr:nucleoside:proton symporter [Phormidium tenue FACHB-886]
MSLLNVVSFLGIFGLCAIAWLFSENRNPKYFPWRVVIGGILLQLVLGALVFAVPGTLELLRGLSNLLNVVFDAADAGARFIFGRNFVPLPGQDPLVLSPLTAGRCPPGTAGQIVAGFCGIQLGYIFAFRALPAVIFFAGLVALLYYLGVIQAITNLFAKIFHAALRLSGAEALSGVVNIFVGVEALIVVRHYLAKMTRSELCAILACCFSSAASSTLAIYSFLRPVFPNILGHLVSASLLAIPASFVLSKILVPEVSIPLTTDDPVSDRSQRYRRDRDANEPIAPANPTDAAIGGVLDGIRMAVAIAGVLILVLGLVYLLNLLFAGLAALPNPVGGLFKVLSLQNIMGALFLPFTVLTGVSLDWQELWSSSVLIGRRLFETAIPPYQALGAAAAAGTLSSRALVIVSYALSGFAHLAALAIFVGGATALAPSRRKDISELGWKALFIGTLATYMIACVAGVFNTGNPGILGQPAPVVAPVAPSPAQSGSPLPTAPVPPAAPSLSPQ